jgi:hypothetical protein
MAKDFDRNLDAALLHTFRRRPAMGFPWERNPMVAHALGGAAPRPAFVFPMPVCQAVPPVMTERQIMGRQVQALPTFRAKRRRVLIEACERATEKDDKRFVAFSKWAAVLEVNPSASQVGRSVLQCQADADAEQKVQTLLDDVFARKATGTMDLRANALLRFVKWHGGCRPSGDISLPIKEADMYEYLGHLKASHAAPTAAAGAMQAWNFCVHVLGFNDVFDTAGSLRCNGSAHRQFLHKRRLRRKDAFHAVMIAVLEIAAEFEGDLTLRAMAGYAVFCTHGRLRNADGNCLVHWDVDILHNDQEQLTGGFVEASAVGIKTGKSKEKRTTFLPVVVPLTGLVSNTWFVAFLNARVELGLPSLHGEPVDVAEELDMASRVVLPSFVKGAPDLSVPVTSEEVAGAIRKTLAKAGFSQKLLGNIASHSMKASWLTITGKAGVEFQLQQLLGYHVVKGESSALNYNRDNLAQPMDAMIEVMDKVRSGEFVPDAPRGQRWPVKTGGKVVPLRDQIVDLIGLDVRQLGLLFSGKEQEETVLASSSSSSAAAAASVSVDVPPTQNESADEADDLQLGELEKEHGFFIVDEELCQISPRHDVDDEELEAAQGEDIDVDGSCAALEDMLTASSSSGSEKSDDGFGSGTDDDDARLGLAGRVISIVEDCRAANLNANSEMVFRHKTRKTVHYGHMNDDAVLACGRPLNENYLQIVGDPGDLWPKCKDCF